MLDRLKNYAAFLVFAVLLWMAWFVWPGAVRADSTPRLPLAYHTSVLGTDYATMVEWENATSGDLVAAEFGEVLVIPSGTYTEFVELFGSTTNADYFRVVMAAEGATVNFVPTQLSHVGDYGSAFNYTVAIWEPYSKVIGLNIDWAGLDGIHNDWLKTPILIHSDVPHVRIIGCAVKNTHAPSYIGAGIAAFSAGTTDTGIINCAVGACDYGIALFNGSDGFLYNNTTKGCTTGYYANASTPVAKNCLAAGNTTDWSGTFTKTTCLDAVPTWATGTDFDIDPADTTALGQGTDLSADAAWAFNYDLHDATRPTLWSIGADDVAAAEPEPEPEAPAVRLRPWAAGPWGAGPWNGGTTGGWK